MTYSQSTLKSSHMTGV